MRKWFVVRGSSDCLCRVNGEEKRITSVCQKKFSFVQFFLQVRTSDTVYCFVFKFSLKIKILKDIVDFRGSKNLKNLENLKNTKT